MTVLRLGKPRQTGGRSESTKHKCECNNPPLPPYPPILPRGAQIRAALEEGMGPFSSLVTKDGRDGGISRLSRSSLLHLHIFIHNPPLLAPPSPGPMAMCSFYVFPHYAELLPHLPFRNSTHTVIRIYRTHEMKERTDERARL